MGLFDNIKRFLRNPATGPNAGRKAIEDANLAVSDAFKLPDGNENTLNGANPDVNGYIRQTNGDLYHYFNGEWTKVANTVSNGLNKNENNDIKLGGDLNELTYIDHKGFPFAIYGAGLAAPSLSMIASIIKFGLGDNGTLYKGLIILDNGSGIDVYDNKQNKGFVYNSDYSINRSFPADNNWIPNAKYVNNALSSKLNTNNPTATGTLTTPSLKVSNFNGGVVYSDLNGNINNVLVLPVSLGGTGVTGSTGTGTAFVLGNAPTLVNPLVGTQVVNDNSEKAASTKYVDRAVSSIVETDTLASVTARGSVTTTQLVSYNTAGNGIKKGGFEPQPNGMYFTSGADGYVDGYQAYIMMEHSFNPTNPFNRLWFDSEFDSDIVFNSDRSLNIKTREPVSGNYVNINKIFSDGRIQGKAAQNTNELTVLSQLQDAIAAVQGVTVNSSATTLTLDARGYYNYVGAGNATWSLPPIAGNTGKFYRIYNISSDTTSSLMLNANGTEQFFRSGVFSNTITLDYGENLTLQCSGTQWNIYN